LAALIKQARERLNPQGDSNLPRKKATQAAVKQGLYGNRPAAAIPAALREALQTERKPPQMPPMTAHGASPERGARCGSLRGLSRAGWRSATADKGAGNDHRHDHDGGGAGEPPSGHQGGAGAFPDAPEPRPRQKALLGG